MSLNDELISAARKSPVITLTDTEAPGIDLDTMRMYRLDRIRKELIAQNIGACVLTTSYSIRYASGVRNCAGFQNHILAGYLFIPANGPVILFDSEQSRDTAINLNTIDKCSDEVMLLSYMYGGNRLDEWMERWAQQMSDLVGAHGGGNRCLAIENGGPEATLKFSQHNIKIVDAAKIVEPARNIKSPEEILCMNAAIAAAEDGMWRMHNALKPGMSEVELWSLLWQANIEAGGDWQECRLLGSGDRTNPWQQEASTRKIRPNELLAFDTDMIGPFGYSADISRTFFCGPGKPSDEQRDLYKRAYEEVHTNIELMKDGVSFQELTETGFRQPERFRALRYPVMMHGIGMSDEWPCVFYPEDVERCAHEGRLETGMCMCVESYVGEVGGREGVKLEQQVLVTDAGCEVLTSFPFEETLLA